MSPAGSKCSELKVLYLASALNRGLLFHFTHLAIALHKKLSGLIVISGSEEEEAGLFNQLKDEGIKVYVNSCIDKPSLRNLFKGVIFLKRLIFHESLDIIHVQTLYSLIVSFLSSKIFLRRKGAIMECGVWKGGSTCKLSIVAKMTRRKLIACDSFEGLPEPAEYDRVHIYSNGTLETYERGDYAGTMEEVKANLHEFGEPEVVELIKGWFHETLPKLRGRKAILVFIDVDLHESIKYCMENLWPILAKGCKFFIHEAHHILTVKLLTDKEFWKKLGEDKPPKLVGTLKGLGKLEPCLGYLEK